MSDFLPQNGNYRNLIAYQKAECIYDVTFFFAHKYLGKGDRTIDQMIQAARSGKQNIAEGSAASATSKETEIKLVNVAKASMQELLVDYEDYLRVRNLERWSDTDKRFLQTKEVAARHNDSEFYRQAIESRSDETIANIAIILINQVDYLLFRLIERLKSDFLKNGGIREAMSQARKNYLNNNNKSKGH